MYAYVVVFGNPRHLRRRIAAGYRRPVATIWSRVPVNANTRALRSHQTLTLYTSLIEFNNTLHVILMGTVNSWIVQIQND